MDAQNRSCDRRSLLALLVQWFGDVPVSTLSREGMTAFMEALSRLPRHAGSHKAQKSLTFRELIELKNVERIAPTTVNLYMECVSALFAWLDTHRTTWGLTGNLAKGLKKKNAAKSSIKRVPSTDDDLRAMFGQPEWTTRMFLHSYGYWLLPLGLYTGARINELCQLDLKDFGEARGHPVVTLCADGLRDKTGKGKRVMPIHSAAYPSRSIPASCRWAADTWRSCMAPDAAAQT